MSQRYDQDLILAYVEDELNEAARQQFERQLEQDPRLQTLVRQLAEDRRRLRSVAPASPPAGLMDRAQGVLERHMLLGEAASHPSEQSARSRHRLVRWSAIGGIAALLLVGVGTMLFIFAETRSFQTVITRVSPREDRAASKAPGPQSHSLAAAPAAKTSEGARDLARKGIESSARTLSDAGRATDAVEVDALAEAPAARANLIHPSLGAVAASAATQRALLAQTLHDWPQQLWRQQLQPQAIPLAIQPPSQPPLRTP